MWILMNDSMISIVADRNNSDQFVVRARFEGDLEAAFGNEFGEFVVESEESDYRYRLFLSKDFVAEVLRDKILCIDYDNFKNSVGDELRHSLYHKVWEVFFRAQEILTPRKDGWWLNYRDNT